MNEMKRTIRNVKRSHGTMPFNHLITRLNIIGSITADASRGARESPRFENSLQALDRICNAKVKNSRAIWI